MKYFSNLLPGLVCLFIFWECHGKVDISCRAILIAVSAKGNCPPQSNCIWWCIKVGPTNQIVLSPIAQDSSEKPSQFQKVILRGSSSSSLYNQSYFLLSLSIAMENSCLKRFWSVSHSQRLSERSHLGWSLNQLLRKGANKNETSSGWSERCPELSHVELILAAIVSRSLGIRVMEAVENNTRTDCGGRYRSWTNRLGYRNQW